MDMVIREIPRFYTGIAEWGACLITINLFRHRIKGWKLWLVSIIALIVQTGFMVVTADLSSDIVWIVCMSVAVALIFLYIYVTCDLSIKDAAYCCARDFLIAEFMASFGWQIYCFFWQEDSPLIIQIFVIFIIYFLIGIVNYILDRKHTPSDSGLNVTDREFFTVAVIVITVFIISNLSFVSMHTPFSGLYDSEIMNIRTIVDLGGIAILYANYVQHNEFQMRRELEAMQNVFYNQYQQYQLSKENIDSLNRKYHDFKHQILALRSETDADKKSAYLDEMENDINDYEAQNKTGNHVLDTVLTSKSLYCARKHIVLTSVVDGKLLDFMDTMDLCSVFGNALDNAIEYEEKIKDRAKRLIHLTVSSQKGFILIRIENYVEDEIIFQDNLPVTQKSDKLMHGFGMKSMKYVAQKYDGTMTAVVNDGWFELKILIPVSEHK